MNQKKLKLSLQELFIPAFGGVIHTMIILVLLMHAQQSLATAVEQTNSEKPYEFSSGVIASLVQAGQSASINTMNEPPAAGGAQSPISAHISRSRDECRLSLQNKDTKYTYALKMNVRVIDEERSQENTRYLSATLKPGEVETRDFRCENGANVRVVLNSGKQVS